MLEVIELNASNRHLLDRVADVFDEAVDPERLGACISDPSHILVVAVFEGVVVGQCLGVIHRHPDKPTDLYVEDLAVDVPMQRRGIATRLIKALLALGQRRGCQSLWVAAEPENTAACQLYASLGLTPRAASVFELQLLSPDAPRGR